MRKILSTCILFLYVFFSFSQGKEKLINTIEDQTQIIDSYTKPDVLSLDPEEFLDKMVDHGAELNGYYEHDRLKKIVKNCGVPTAMIITTFYFWNDRLIYVNYKQKEYMKRQNKLGYTVSDYSHSYTKFESKHYFDKEKQFKKEIIGVPLKEVVLEKEFKEYSLRMKALLDDKFNNRSTYVDLQGKWVNMEFPDEYIIFEETLRFNFRGGKFIKKFKVKIKDGVMSCSSPNNDYVYKYKIESLSRHELVLQNMQDKSSSPILYRKEEQ